MKESSIKLFISYAHKDEEFLGELVEHLSNLQRQGIIQGWHDRKIIAGEQWADEIDKALNDAQIILLLISASFMASNYCHDLEMRQAMERHETGEAIVIPIIIRECDWTGAPFSKLQALPKDAKPVKSWNDRDQAWADVVRGIRKAIEGLMSSSRPGAPGTSSKRTGQGLPYLCDRSTQKEELREALRQHRRERPHRPFLCLIHGDERECHDKFLDRLKDDIFPELLQLKVSFEECIWHEPPPPHASEIRFWLSLSEKLLSPPPDSVDECREHLRQELARLEKPLFIHLGWLTENCERSGDELFSTFLQLWENWPDLPPNRLVICLLSLQYQRSKEAASRLAFWRKSPNEWLRQRVDELKKRATGKFSLVVLTELQAISRGDAQDWAKHPKVRSNWSIPTADIANLYRLNNDQPIEMEKLAPQLQQLLNSQPIA